MEFLATVERRMTLHAEGGVFMNATGPGTTGVRHVAKAAGTQKKGGYGAGCAIVVSLTLTCT